MKIYHTQFIVISIFISIHFLCGCSNSSKIEQNRYQTIGSIEILDSTAIELIDPMAEIQVLASGFSWSEGPVWVEKHQMLLFSDVPTNTVYKWTEGDSTVIYLNPSGHEPNDPNASSEGANGLIINQMGELVICQHGARQVAVMNAELNNPDEEYKPLIDSYNGKRYNSPNDIVQHPNGSYYFTDPPYGLADDKLREIDRNGVYLLRPDGTSVMIIDTLSRPNGIELSPDAKTLYVAQSNPESAKYYAYDLDENGEIIDGEILYDATKRVERELLGLPDGMVVHQATGNIFATGPGGVLVISPEGKHLATINTGKATANCTLDDEETTLYITAGDLLLRLPLK